MSGERQVNLNLSLTLVDVNLVPSLGLYWFIAKMIIEEQEKSKCQSLFLNFQIFISLKH